MDGFDVALNALGKRICAQDQAADPTTYRARFNGGNVGVLLGKPSKGLCTVDVDDAQAKEEFFQANPALRASLQTTRVRGCNVWLRIRGAFPDAGKIKRREDDQPVGEWRAEPSPLRRHALARHGGGHPGQGVC
jgi:hypothetical protein